MNYKKFTIGAKYNIRIEDVIEPLCVMVECGSCGKEGVIGQNTLAESFKPYIRIVTIENKFKCLTCANTVLNSWYIVKPVTTNEV